MSKKDKPNNKVAVFASRPLNCSAAAEGYRQRRLEYVLQRLEKDGTKALYLIYNYPNLSHDLFAAIRKMNNLTKARVWVGKPKQCEQNKRFGCKCHAPLAPPENGDGFLWCLDNHGVVYYGDFAGLWVG